MKNQPKSIHRQRGLTFYGWAFAILVFAFTLLCAYRVAPPYFDNWQVQSALESLDQLTLSENAYEGASDDQIRSHLTKFFTINNVPDALIKNVKITRTKGRVYVDLNWEYQNHFFQNIDVVVKFENQYDSLNPTDCCKPTSTTTAARE